MPWVNRLRAGAALCAVTLAAASCSTPNSPASQRPTEAPPPSGPRPAVVLVHGAWADTSSWDGEVDALKKKGYDVRAIANPLENLTTDAASVADLPSVPRPARSCSSVTPMEAR